MGRMGQQLIKTAKKEKRFKIHSLTESKNLDEKINGIKCQLNNEKAFVWIRNFIIHDKMSTMVFFKFQN